MLVFNWIEREIPLSSEGAEGVGFKGGMRVELWVLPPGLARKSFWQVLLKSQRWQTPQPVGSQRSGEY